MTLPIPIPDTIPGPVSIGTIPPSIAGAQSNYDIAIDGIEFVYANDATNPNVRQTADFEKQRVDQETTPGEQTLTNWWLKSQESFHGGAGQLQLEAAVPTPLDHIRFDLSRNVDVWTPGVVQRLPDTSVLTTDVPVTMVSILNAGADAVVYAVSGGTCKLLNIGGSTSTFTRTGVLALSTDGTHIYAATATGVYQLDPTNVATSTLMYSYSSGTPVLGWVKSRLMLGVNGAVYELDVSSFTGAAVGSTQLRYQSPTTNFQWRCFAESPQAILAAGDATGVSVISRFSLQNVSGVLTLQANGDIATLPMGERVLSLLAVEGSFLAIGTTQGVRIGTYDTLQSNLSYGPLTLAAGSPQLPTPTLLTRGSYVYAVGQAYDEAGLIRVNLGTQIDQSGRYAWAPDLICPSHTVAAATASAMTQLSNLIVFAVPGVGILIEGQSPGTGREAWLRTSRIRYGTTEPKLFKLGRVRGNFTAGTIRVDGGTPNITTALATVGPRPDDAPEFRLPTDPTEWLQLTFTLSGSSTVMNNYAVKALTGTRRQRDIQVVLWLADTVRDKTNRRHRSTQSARDRLSRLEASDNAGDEVVFQEFTPTGVISTLVVIQKVQFVQTAKPTDRSDVGGKLVVTMRTVE